MERDSREGVAETISFSASVPEELSRRLFIELDRVARAMADLVRLQSLPAAEHSRYAPDGNWLVPRSGANPEMLAQIDVRPRLRARWSITIEEK